MLLKKEFGVRMQVVFWCFGREFHENFGVRIFLVSFGVSILQYVSYDAAWERKRGVILLLTSIESKKSEVLDTYKLRTADYECISC